MSWLLYASIEAVGTPRPQPRVKARAFAGHAQVYTPDTAKGWKEIIMLEAAPFAGRQIEGPIALKIVFSLPHPKAHKKDRFVTTKPDIDNLLKSTMDALTDRAVWRDDAQIAEVHTKKVYESEKATPGATIEIYSWREG